MVRVAVAGMALAMLTAGCASGSGDDSPPGLERIDGPAEVDEERLDGQPGAVNDGDQGG